LRPFLVHAAADLGSADLRACRRVAAAVELVHCYSLVHDDLPAMDDAALRRGKPSCHSACGEAVAILAGDALVALAFEVLAIEDWPAQASLRATLVARLARAAGVVGMCGGQMLDLDSGDRPLGEADLLRLQGLKTGAIIRFSLEAGCLLAGLADTAREAVDAYGEALGIAFQIRDDLLDLHGSAAETGKNAGRDDALGRTTFVTLLGEDGALRRLRLLREEAFGALDRLDGDTTLLRDLFDFVISRRN
jgi:farnesyl diphosphate synthase